MDSNWILVLAILAVVIASLAFKRFTQLGTAQARQMIADGAVVIDVRNPDEFRRGAVPGAINIPLNSLAAVVPKQFPNRQQVFLVHCLSGGRSLIGCRTLQQLGYPHAHNLGSVSHARVVCQPR